MLTDVTSYPYDTHVVRYPCCCCCVCPVHAVRIEDITTQNHYKNAAEQEQQVLGRQTLSTALLETYENCDAPPCLQEFTQYREDQKEGLTFFTNPAYFFELWRKQQDQQIENRKRKKVCFHSYFSVINSNGLGESLLKGHLPSCTKLRTYLYQFL